MKTKLNPVADLPALPAYASGALYFLDSRDPGLDAGLPVAIP